MIGIKIIEKFVQGDRVGFDLVYKAYSSGMYSICLRYLRCDDDAKEVLQETFIKIYEARESFDTSRSIGAWIKTITIRTALNYIKKNYKMVLIEDETQFDAFSNPVVEEESNSMKDILKKALENLPDGYRVVFQLFAIENLTHKEIADYLGIKEGTSKSQYSKAKSMIKRMIENQKVTS